MEPILNICFCSLSNIFKQHLTASAQARMQGQMVDLERQNATSKERNPIELIKAPIFLEAVLAVETMQEPQSNLEWKKSQLLKRLLLFKTHTFSYQQHQGYSNNENTCWVFPALKLPSTFLTQFTVLWVTFFILNSQTCLSDHLLKWPPVLNDHVVVLL